MRHLNKTEFIDFLDGELPPARVAHVAGCPDCTAQLDALRVTLACIDDQTTDGPSPLFWDTFPSRVTAAVNTRPHGAWWLSRPAAALLCCAAVLLVAVVVAFNVTPWSASAPASPVATGAPDTSVPADDDDLDQDAAWAAVRTAADDLDYDDVVAAGIFASPGTAERAAMELSDEQRAELVRLIEREIKRAGGV